MTLSPILQALGATIAAAFAWLWWTRRKATQRAEAQERRAEAAEAKTEQTAAERDRAQLQEAATAAHAADQAHGFEAAGEIHADATGHPDRDRAALYDRMRDAAHRRSAGAGTDPDPAVRAVPGPGATGGNGAGHGR